MRKLFVQTLFIALLISPPLLYAQNEIYNRLSLEECIKTGLQNNPAILSSQFFVEETQTKIDEAHSGYYPKVNLNSNATTYSNNNGSQRYENYNTGISASYNLFNGYRTKAGYNAAKDNYEANIFQHESIKQDLVLNITYAYYKTLQAERILKSTEEAVKNSQLHLDFANARNIAGMATRSDILKSEVELSNAELEKIKATNSLLAAKGNLNQLMGLPSNNAVEIVDDLSELNENPVQSYDSLFAEAMESRVEVKRFYSLLNAQQNYIQLAKGEYFPSLDANANYNFAGEKISGMQQNWWLGMTLTIPVFKGFSTKARVAGEEIALKGLEKDFEALKQQIGQEIWDAFLAVNESSERVMTTSKGLESARENLSLSEGEYKEGTGSIIQLTDAQTTFVAAEQNYIQAVADYKISLAELRRTTGNL
ncbi:TolC family protein [Gaoshiqia sediminis]|uniref:TolC family protein n=1 Tax=Gaoshiqia sediminis TaxID=2986998 RepID=A0AA41YAJ9_9BACT|nr:TolC family protein [Gaoshiqia sediminis]MCW0482335.1 TolC family protein [Gaoshiqia sediminis]